MKTLTKISSGVIITLCLIFSGCTRNDSPEPVETGMLKLNVGVSVVVNDLNSRLKSAVSPDNFHVQIFNSNNQVVKDYAHVSDIPDTVTLAAGQYYAVATSENNQPAAFDNPYYSGNSGIFTITAGQVSTADITCSLANIMVTVIYSSQLTGTFSDYSTKVSNASGNLVFSKTETRSGYFDAGPLQIEATLVYTMGSTVKTKKLTGQIAAPETGKHYEVHIDATQSDGGSILNVILNETVVTEIVNITGEGTVVDNPTGTGSDLLITEIMFDPAILADNLGEWIEIYNNSGQTINLKDMVIRKASESFHKINSDVNIAPGTYAVLGNSLTATQNVNYNYGSAISLTNTTGFDLILATYGTNGLDGTVMCSVNYRSSGFPAAVAGKSMQLDPAITNASAATLGSNWCISTLTFSTGDYGTPGLANTACQ